MVRTSAQSVRPDIIDVFIIILLAAAVDIFIFWMATQFIANPVFQTLPDFVTGALSGVWTSIATGTAGIGLVLVKYLATARAERPNYFVYVAGTAAGLFVLILLLAVTSIFVSGLKEGAHPPRPPPPSGAFLLNIPSDGSGQIINQENGNQWFSYSYQGTIALKDGVLKGTLKPSSFKTSERFQPLPGQTLNAMAVKFCRWVWTGGNWSVDWSPTHNGVKNSIPINVPLKDKLTLNLPNLDFEVPVPPGAERDQSWLCLRLDFNGGGYFPFP
ncbi:hypothetical protein [Neorhizobium galegae]|uniref:hypothetical protein n=1 Tax=Neorhizobium galegae TaxID=399 RepID=UPI00062243F3|nr:hypothetical protein [Neorhizobium galegae]KAB1125568.1 hypothetical protein F4V90_00105 [Neorhizobium galegae]MCQ1805827.1 hypothetical protein [Neorhizobium galegae]CDZ59601.1 Hypothetical protein NGAL_HAMBI2566_35900 [Neorhizobium galegae bv. orientalis]